MTNATETARAHIANMERAAHATAFAPSHTESANRANAARWVLAYLTGGKMYGVSVTADDARREAKRAWPEGIPTMIREAISKEGGEL